MKRYVWYISIVGLREFTAKVFPSTKIGNFAFRNKVKRFNSNNFDETLDLKPGDWVEVRSAKEIFSTLDAQGKLKGLRFTPEMAKFCGKRFRVFKSLAKIILEATGELRKIKTPTVLLEGVFCDGSAHADCDRSCFCFWREQWLRRVSSTSS